MAIFLHKHIGKDKYFYRVISRIFGVLPNNIELFKLALIHRSASVVLDDRTFVNNERLEFLGDAVIEAIVSEMLFIEYPELNEGAMTQLRSRIVSRTSLNQLAISIGLNSEVIANPTSINTHKQNIFGDAFEAMVGALYLDKGYNKTNRILITLLNKYIDIELMTQTEYDFKSRIIEWSQKNKKTVEFSSGEFVSEQNDLSPNFEIILYIDSQAVGFGSGRSKKEAEQRAARQAYDALCQ